MSISPRPLTTDPTWPEATYPTWEQWQPWFDQQSNEYKRWWFEFCEHHFEVSNLCHRQDHEYYKEELHDLRQRHWRLVEQIEQFEGMSFSGNVDPDEPTPIYDELMQWLGLRRLFSRLSVVE